METRLMDRTEAQITREDRVTAFLLALGAALERRRRVTGRAWLAAVPVVLVNYVAFRAQLRFWQDHLERPDAFLVSVALESIAVYWAWLAHQAMVADDSALRPRLAAYGIALLIGVLNYSHYCKPGWKPTVAAVTFGMMSVISPWLWTAYSRRMSRPALKARNLIEDHAVRLGITRWFWHAYRCVRVMRWATWTGENRPAVAIGAVYPGLPEPGDRKSTAPKSPPSGPVLGEPQPVATAVAAARVKAPEPGLTAARTDAERALARRLIEQGSPLPTKRGLAEWEDPALTGSLSTRRRAAERCLADARAGLDGHVRVNGS